MTWLGYVELQFATPPDIPTLSARLAPYVAPTNQSHEVLQLGTYGANIIAEALWWDSFDAEAVKTACDAQVVTVLGETRAQGLRIALRLTTRSQRYTHDPNWYVDSDFQSQDLPAIAQDWLAGVFAAYDNPHVDFDWWSDARFAGDLYTAARPMWFTAAGALAGFLATGSLDLLDIVDSLVARVLLFMRDADNDGFDELVYQSGVVSPLLVGTDNGMDANLLASWLMTAAYALHLNRAYDSFYGEHADAIETWMFDHYLAEMIAEGQNAPAAPDDVYHCWTRGALWLHFLQKLWGYREYEAKLTSIFNVVHPSLENTLLERANGSLVWDHRPAGHGAWGLQPSVYAGDTLISLTLLALEGVLDYTLLPKLAKTITENIFAGQATFDGERDVGGHVVLEGEPFPVGNSDSFPLVNASRFRQTGFAALTTWDDSGVISALADTAQATTANEIALCGWMLFAEANI